MKLGIFAFLMLVSAASNAALAGFEGLDWKMSEQQVRMQYPNFEEWDESEISLFNGKQVMMHRYGLRSHIVAGCKFAVRLEFSDNKLFQVVLFQDIADETDCSEMVKRQLFEKYGTNTIKESNGEETLMWSQGKTTVVLVSYRLSENKRHIEIIYTDDEALRKFFKPKNDL